MTNPTQLIAAAQIIADAGGPKWPEWCDVKTGCVKANVDEVWSTEPEWCYCPPACEAAICWYAGEVQAWGLRTHKAVADISTAEGGRQWKWFVCGNKHISELAESQLEASTALILAVAEAMEGDTDEAIKKK